MANTTREIPGYLEPLLADIDAKLGYLVEEQARVAAKVDEDIGRFGPMVDHLEGIELHLESVTGQLTGIERRLDGRGPRGRRATGARARSRRTT